MTKDRDLNDEVAALKKKLQEAYQKENHEVISVIEPLIKGKEGELERHIKMLREKFPLFAATKYPKPMGLDETALKPDERVLVYHVTDSGVIIYLAKGKKIIQALFKPIAKDELDRLVITFRRPLEILPGRDDFGEKLRSFDFAAGKEALRFAFVRCLKVCQHWSRSPIVPGRFLGHGALRDARAERQRHHEDR